MKYAVLHRSYSAPVRVCDIADVVSLVSAARATTFALLVVAVRVFTVVRPESRAAPRELPWRLITLPFCARVDWVDWRGVVTPRDITAERVFVAPVDVAERGVAPDARGVDTVRDCTVFVFCDCRFVAFSSRTAASAMPMNAAKIPIK